jgi:hypothetical protein
MADATAATSPTRRRLTRKRPPSAVARTASIFSGSAFRTVVRVAADTFKIIQNHRWRAIHLCKDRRKRRKTGARILPPMWNADLLDCRRRDEPKFSPSVWGLCANVLRLSRRCRFGLVRNCAGSPTWAPFVAWTGSELRPDKDAWNQFSCLSFSAIENSECSALRQQSSRKEHVPGDQLAPLAINE